MSTEKLPKANLTAASELAFDANDWLQQFVKHFEHHFIDSSYHLPADTARNAHQRVAMAAFIRTLADSGLDRPALLELIAEALVEECTVDAGQWTSELNERRFQLIDREFQGLLTFEEQLELANLTRMMRQYVETEENLPFAGARALHARLLHLHDTDRAS